MIASMSACSGGRDSGPTFGSFIASSASVGAATMRVLSRPSLSKTCVASSSSSHSMSSFRELSVGAAVCDGGFCDGGVVPSVRCVVGDAGAVGAALVGTRCVAGALAVTGGSEPRLGGAAGFESGGGCEIVGCETVAGGAK